MKGRLVERVSMWGIPATVVAEAHVTLPGDEQVPLNLELSFVNGEPVIRFNGDEVRRVIDERHLTNG